MALRVLLADESSTIKKVIQLALQDFAVEVKSVHSGVDVLEVAKSFKPDLIFADVLLQKRNGYEASAELKSAFETKAVPVVLMWSSFMELDEAAYQRSHADARLEKPFDAETLRSLVTDLVAKTRTQTLGQHLEFPAGAFPREEAAPVPPRSAAGVPPAARTAQAAPPPPPAPPAAAPRAATPPSAPAQQPSQTVAPAAPSIIAKVTTTRQPEGPRSFDLDDENSPFQSSELPKTDPQTPPPPPAPAPERPSRNWEDITMPKVDNDNDENWSHQNLSQFNVNLEPLKIESDNVSIEFDVQHGELEGQKRLLPRDMPTEQEIAPKMDQNDNTISRTGYLAPQEQTSTRGLYDADENPNTELRDDGFSVLSSFETEEAQDMQIPRMSPAFDPPSGAFQERRSQPAPAPLELDASIPQMTADELERIVRAQSREIIEALVRKIVPDLASEMIREELNRLIGPA